MKEKKWQPSWKNCNEWYLITSLARAERDLNYAGIAPLFCMSLSMLQIFRTRHKATIATMGKAMLEIERAGWSYQ